LDSVLLGIVCRISEYPGIYTAADTILAIEDDAMFIRLYKLIVENELP
jgi:hypothetical protein